MKKFFDYNPGEVFNENYGNGFLPMVTSKIEVSELAYKKLFYYVDATNIEISGLGSAQKMDKNSFLIKDLYLFKQESTMANTLLSQEAIAQFLTSWITLGKNPSEIRLWWHSHADGNVFWSGVDDATCERFDSDDFMISLVANKNHELLGRVDLYKPTRFSDKEIIPTIKLDLDSELQKQCKAEVLKKNKRRKFNARFQKRFFKASWPIQPFEITEFY